MSKDTQQAQVGREQGAARFFCKEAGNMNFDDQDFTGKQMRLKLLSNQTMTQWGASGTTISGTRISPAYGYHMISLATGLSLTSVHLASVPDAGAVLVIDGTKMVGDANASVIALSDGITVVDEGSVAVSSLELSAAARVKFMAPVDGTWAIVERNASVTVRAA